MGKLLGIYGPHDVLCMAALHNIYRIVAVIMVNYFEVCFVITRMLNGKHNDQPMSIHYGHVCINDIIYQIACNFI